MIPRGQVVGYSAQVTIDPALLVCQTTFPNPIKAFAQAMQSKLLTAGLLLQKYTIKNAGGMNFKCSFTLQLINGFPSKQTIVTQVSSLITMETGKAPSNAVDPPVYIGCGLVTCGPCALPVSSTPSLVGATGSMTPAQIAAGLPGQCKNGPGGAQGFPGCVKGTSVAVCKNQVSSGFWDTVLGNTYCAGKTVKCALPSTSTWAWIGLGLFVVLLSVVFVYGKARSV